MSFLVVCLYSRIIVGGGGADQDYSGWGGAGCVQHSTGKLISD